MLRFPFTIIFVAIVMFENIKSGYLLVEVEDDSPLPPQPGPPTPKPKPLPTKPQPLPPTPPTLPPPPYTAPPPKPTEAPVVKQEGEPCGHPYGRYGPRASDPTVHNCAAGLDCKPRGYSMICVRIEPVTPGYNPRDYGQGGSYNPGHGGSYNPGHGGSNNPYNPGHGGSYNPGHGGSYNNGKGGSNNNGKGGWGIYE